MYRAGLRLSAANAGGFAFERSSFVTGRLVGTWGALVFLAATALVFCVQIRDLHPKLLLQISQPIFVRFR
jgi:hypothetical protein